MELNSRQQEIMIERVNMLWRNKSCTMCGGAKWTLSGKIFEMREFQGGNLVLGGESSIYPVIPIYP